MRRRIGIAETPNINAHLSKTPTCPQTHLAYGLKRRPFGSPVSLACCGICIIYAATLRYFAYYARVVVCGSTTL